MHTCPVTGKRKTRGIKVNYLRLGVSERQQAERFYTTNSAVCSLCLLTTHLEVPIYKTKILQCHYRL